MWGTPWGIGRILFTLTHYSPLFECVLLAFMHFTKSHSLSPRMCSLIYQISGWCIFVGVGIAEAVFIFRTYAIWKQSSKILCFLGCVFWIIGIPGIYLTHIAVSRVQFGRNPLPSGQSCFIVDNQGSTWTLLWDYALTLILETVILFVTLVPAIRHHWRTSSLMRTLYKDGIMYYVFLAAFSIGNLICLGAFRNTTGASLVLLQRVMHSVLTSRILLHIRHAGAKDRQELLTLSGVVDWYPQEQISTVVLGVDTLFGCDFRSTLERIHEVEVEHC